MVAFVSLCPHTEDGTRELLGTFLKRALILFMKAPPPRTITVGIRFQCMDFGWVSTVAQTVKNLPAMRETQVRSLGREDPLEKEMATRSSILAWEIPWTEEPGGLQSMGLQSWTQLSD